MKIYTQTGDGGQTSLLSGERVPKHHVRIAAYGEVDELNAVIGALSAVLAPGHDETRGALLRVQSDLLHMGAWLAASPDSPARQRLVPISPSHSRHVEALIDAMEAELPELKAFVIPGGHAGAAWAHVARTVCRRVERAVIHLARDPQQAQEAPEDLSAIIAYLNRLSDYFFVLSRYLNHKAGVADLVWRP